MLVRQLDKVLQSVNIETSKSDGMRELNFTLPDYKDWYPGEKTMYLREMAAQKRDYGADCRTFDTQGSESYHKQTINPIISRTSKRSSTLLHECSEAILLDERVDILHGTADGSEPILERQVDKKYPYVPSNCKISVLSIFVKRSGEPCIKRGRGLKSLYCSVDPVWLAMEVADILGSYGVDVRHPTAYNIICHEKMTVLGDRNQELKLHYHTDKSRNCCGIQYRFKSSDTTVQALRNARVCGVLEITFVDANGDQRSFYRILVSVLTESVTPSPFLPYSVWKQECIDGTDTTYVACRLIKPLSIAKGIALIPYLREEEGFDSTVDATDMEYYVVYEDDMQYGLLNVDGSAKPKTTAIYTGNVYDIHENMNGKCFLSEGFLRLEQDRLGLNEKKVRRNTKES
jgi:hypothetical protein